MANFDLIVYGATGATGGQTIAYLNEHAKTQGITWAVAGRNREKLEASVSQFSANPDGIVIADASDNAAVEQMVKQTKALINLAGPYALYGEPIIAACAQHGVAYADLAGEILFVKSMMDKYGEAALASGAKIIPTCGYEALPFDMGCFLAVDRFTQTFGKKPDNVNAIANFQFDGKYLLPSDGVSGGTWGSGVEMMKSDDLNGIENPHLLLQSDNAWLPKSSQQYHLLKNVKSKKHGWLAPMLPSPWLNPAIIYRSQEIFNTSDNEQVTNSPEDSQGFHYTEGMDTSGIFLGDKLLKPFVATSTAAAMQVAETMMKLPIAAPRKLLGSFMKMIGPAPGKGPKAERLDLWRYTISFYASDDAGNESTSMVEGIGQPGYKSTADMIGQVGILLASNDTRLPQRSGFLTPSTALGLDVLDDFAAARLSFT